jgi:hypothetical protein
MKTKKKGRYSILTLVSQSDSSWVGAVLFFDEYVLSGGSDSAIVVWKNVDWDAAGTTNSDVLSPLHCS